MPLILISSSWHTSSPGPGKIVQQCRWDNVLGKPVEFIVSFDHVQTPEAEVTTYNFVEVSGHNLECLTSFLYGLLKP
jgi:hypothetical protein